MQEAGRVKTFFDETLLTNHTLTHYLITFTRNDQINLVSRNIPFFHEDIYHFKNFLSHSLKYQIFRFFWMKKL